MLVHWLKSAKLHETTKSKKIALGLNWDCGSRSYTVKDGCPNLQRALNKVLGNPRLCDGSGRDETFSSSHPH